MELKKETIRLTVAVMFALIFIVLMVFFPRSPTIHGYGIAGTLDFNYHFDMNLYKENISQFFQHLWMEKSLGGTRFQFTTAEEEILRYYPKSLLVISIAFITSLCLGIWKGIYDYRNLHTRKNIIGNGTTWVFQSIPDFFLVILFFWISFYFLPHGEIFSNNNWYSFAAPALLASIYPMMYVARLTNVSLLNQDGQDYIRTAFSKGNSSSQVIKRHIMKNSLADIISHLPTIIIVIISNLLMIEYLTGFEGAANRLFVALGGRQSSISTGMSGSIEAELVLGLVLCFMLTVLFVHILKLFLLAKFIKKGG
ncbi:ABC transporter permease subunit [Sutcliffiella deserti]|uniref:ABC transporter permease subunit n=1 Tax=Sutcliffiella deserti TaxID=2875501 RepID=UPI001CC08B8F|nr:ABC transporter permease subunit [Sutcliffiella deserti]